MATQIKWHRSRNFHVLRYRASLWWQLTLNDCLAPITDSAARLQIVALPCLIYIVFQLKGFWATADEIRDQWLALLSLLLAVPFFIVANALLALLNVGDHERKLGLWSNGQFVYHVPQLLVTRVVSSDDHETTFPIKVAGYPKGAYIEYQWERPIWDTATHIALLHSPAWPCMFDNVLRSSGFILLPDDLTIHVQIHKPGPSNPSIIQVKILSWYVPNPI